MARLVAEQSMLSWAQSASSHPSPSDIFGRGRSVLAGALIVPRGALVAKIHPSRLRRATFACVLRDCPLPQGDRRQRVCVFPHNPTFEPMSAVLAAAAQLIVGHHESDRCSGVILGA